MIRGGRFARERTWEDVAEEYVPVDREVEGRTIP